MGIERFRLGRPALGIGLAVLLAGCGGPQNSTTSAMPQSAMGAPNTMHKTTGSSGDLMYVADESDNISVSIVTYPQGQPYATITNIGPAWGICSDTMGNVWVNTLGATAYEYAHGGTTPIASLHVPNTALPTGCSVDPTTGNLAVISLGFSGDSMVVWPQAQGTPTSYPTPFEPVGCTYDTHGNLFIDGYVSTTNLLLLAELPKGGSTFTNIVLDNKNTKWAGGIEWDGEHVAVNTLNPANPRGKRHLIYRIKVSGSQGQIVGTTYLKNPEQTAWLWFQGKALIATTVGGEVGFWKYPEGGRLFKKITGFQGPWGVTISVAPNR